MRMPRARSACRCRASSMRRGARVFDEADFTGAAVDAEGFEFVVGVILPRLGEFVFLADEGRGEALGVANVQAQNIAAVALGADAGVGLVGSDGQLFDLLL